MSRKRLGMAVLAVAALTGCGKKEKPDQAAEAPPATKVLEESNSDSVRVEKAEQFALVTAGARTGESSLKVTGVVNVDISRAVPVISLSSGRIVEVHARLGDQVTKGQLLMKVQSTDVSAAFSDYRQAVVDEKLSRAQLDRAKTLYDKGAIAQKDLEIAQDVADKTRVTVETTLEKIRVLGADPSHPGSLVEVRAPISGTITEQQVTAAAGTQGLASPNPFVISNLSTVWVICDVYENDLAQVRVGESADVRLNAYPERVFKGRISAILPVLDPGLRTAKVRLEIVNPGMMRVGMFVTATLHGTAKTVHATVPASAILHLHDREWIYIPSGEKRFTRVEVKAGMVLPDGMQELLSGIQPGERLVANALVMQSTVEQ